MGVPQNAHECQGVNVKSPELKALPEGWAWKVSSSGRVFFQKGEDKTYEHPSFGPLPGRWVFRFSKEPTGSGRSKVWTEYYDRDSGKTSQRDPRGARAVMALEMLGRPRSDSIRGNRYRLKPGEDLSQLKRSEIGTINRRSDYLQIKVLDPGDGTKGGMNGGVYGVCLKSKLNHYFVEKRFTKDQYDLAKSEIQLLHKLRHGSLTTFVDAFMDPIAKIASVYVEFCDLGDLNSGAMSLLCLGDMYRLTNTKVVESYGNRRPVTLVPEQFIWHILIGLVDGLAFLEGGRKYLETTDFASKPGWVPIIHRDMKPDNVLLRSRSTLGSTKYPYCVISDFGLACEGANGWHQQASGAFGTSMYFAPELCCRPWPRTESEATNFPAGARHNAKSDLWSVGASVFNLISINYSNWSKASHINWNIPPEVGMYIYKDPNQVMKSGDLKSAIQRSWVASFQSRVEMTPTNEYSIPLEEAIKYCTNQDPTQRPTPIKMIEYLRNALKNRQLMKYLTAGPPLPEWALKKHEYHALAKQALARQQNGAMKFSK